MCIKYQAKLSSSVPAPKGFLYSWIHFHEAWIHFARASLYVEESHLAATF